MTDQHQPDQPDQPDSQRGDPWEGEMATEFDRRVRDLHEAPLTLDQVRGRATRIRRNRRAAAAGAVLAAAAVVVPLAVATAGGIGPDRSEIPPATGTLLPTGTPTTATDPATPTPTATTPPAARVASYLVGAELHLPDGSVRELPSADYENAAVIADNGFTVATRRDAGGNLTVDYLIGDDVVDQVEAASDFVVADDDRSAVFVTVDGDLRVVAGLGVRTLSTGWSGWSVTAVAGDCRGGSASCRVVMRDDQKSEAPVILDADGARLPLPVTADAVYDVSDAGALAVVDKVSDDGSCGGVYDEAAGDFAFRTCDHTVQQFSPDGRLVLGAPAYLDGPGDVATAVLDASTGDEVARLEVPGATIIDTRWVDGDTVAALLLDFSEQSWTIRTLTVGDDGPEVVLGPEPGDEFDGPFHLAG